jgi:hypothetical protein
MWVYRAAERLIKQHGAEALNEADRLIELALIARTPTTRF